MPRIHRISFSGSIFGRAGMNIEYPLGLGVETGAQNEERPGIARPLLVAWGGKG
jgi:hypothetical protein